MRTENNDTTQNKEQRRRKSVFLCVFRDSVCAHAYVSVSVDVYAAVCEKGARQCWRVASRAGTCWTVALLSGCGVRWGACWVLLRPENSDLEWPSRFCFDVRDHDDQNHMTSLEVDVESDVTMCNMKGAQVSQKTPPMASHDDLNRVGMNSTEK